MTHLRRQPTPPRQSSKIQILSNADQQIISDLQERLAEQKADITSRTNSLQELRGKMELISNRMKGLHPHSPYLLSFSQENTIKPYHCSRSMMKLGEE